MRDDQAEQVDEVTSRSGKRCDGETSGQCNLIVCDDQDEPCLSAVEDLEATQDRGQAEQDDSPGSSHTINTRQSHTIPWAVARYVSIPAQSNPMPVLTLINPGAKPADCQAEQHCSKNRDGDIEEDQAEKGQAEQCTAQKKGDQAEQVD